MDAKELLEGLRWDENMCITNHFNERVWLKSYYNKDGVISRITECCYEDDPCEIHKKIAEEQKSK